MSPALAEGQQLGPCRIVAEIGRGERATVYRAFQPALDREVAVKVLAAGADPAFAERFRETSRTLARLRHANIAQVYAFGEQDGLLYLVRELVDGESALRRLGSLSPDQIINVLAQAAAGLDYAHARDVVHGDLLPSNVLLDQDGRALIVDFGLAPAGQPATRESDMRALTRLARQLFSGQLEPPESLNVPPEVAAVLNRDDFPTATAFASELRAAAGGLGGETAATVAYGHSDTQATMAYQPQAAPERTRRKPVWLYAGIPAAVVLLAGAAWLLRPAGPAPSAAPAATSQPAPSSGATTVSPGVETGAGAAEAGGLAARPSASASAAPAASGPGPASSNSPGATPTAINNAAPPMYMAISRDGANFQPAQALPVTGVFLGAFGLPNGGLRLYGTDGSKGRLHAFSTADYHRWDEEPLNAEQTFLLGDIVRLGSGGYRLYYLPLATVTRPGDAQPQKALKSARSTDGLTWADEDGFRFTDPGLQMGTVAPAGAGWQMIVATAQSGQLATRALTSPDGLSFSPLPGATIPEGSGAPKLSAFDGQFHLLFAAAAAITSWSSEDGRSWRLDPGVRLRMDSTKLALQPGIIKTDDGVYRLLFSLVNRSSASASAAAR